jgi:NitT/TauT family transport system substrate-binding protein
MLSCGATNKPPLRSRHAGQGERTMSKFTIQPHGRLQEWVADEKGYFRDEGLDYEFLPGLAARSRKQVDGSGAVAEVRSGAFESYKQASGNKGVKSDISCACHWAVNQASAQRIGTMWDKAYVVTPGGIMVPPESPIRAPEDLAGREIAVGYHSGSHFTTIQALEPFLTPDQIKLKFVGSVWARVDVGVDRNTAATSVWGLTYQVLEQFGFRKIVDTSFMIGFMFPAGVDPADVEKYMNAMRRAQMDLDLAPEKYKHHYLNEIPERYKATVDVRRFAAGERVVFLPYTEATYARTRSWLEERGLFDDAAAVSGRAPVPAT